MAILALNERLVSLGIAGIRLAISVVAIHRAINISIRSMSGLLKLDWALTVNGVNPLLGLGEVLTIARLVAKAPHDDAGMIVVGKYVVLVALHDGLGKERSCRGSIVAITKSVTLLIGFCTHVYSILIAEVIPLWVVGIVGCAHGVDIELLHAHNVLNHTLTTHHIAAIGVELVAVHTLDEYRLTVDEQLAVAYLHTSETYFLHHILSSTPDGERI